MKRKQVVLNFDVYEMLEEVRKEYLRHHKEMQQVHISNNKVIFEALHYYLRH